MLIQGYSINKTYGETSASNDYGLVDYFNKAPKWKNGYIAYSVFLMFI